MQSTGFEVTHTNRRVCDMVDVRLAEEPFALCRSAIQRKGGPRVELWVIGCLHGLGGTSEGSRVSSLFVRLVHPSFRLLGEAETRWA
jgi:hypothetical protein